MTTRQPEALDLADWLIGVGGGPSAQRAAALLRSQHARITELEAQLEAVGAGGVGPLIADAGFDAADMATAAAQGFRDGVASVSAGSEPWLACHLVARPLRGREISTPMPRLSTPTPPPKREWQGGGRRPKCVPLWRLPSPCFTTHTKKTCPEFLIDVN